VTRPATEVKTETVSTSTTSKKRGSVSPKKPIPKVLSTPHPPPKNWEETYATIKAMRARFIAPVDTMGCQMAQVAEKDPKVRGLDFLQSSLPTVFTEPTIFNTGIIDAILANERRGVSRCGEQPAGGIWREHLPRRYVSSGQRCHFKGHSKSGILEQKDDVSCSLASAYNKIMNIVHQIPQASCYGFT